MIDHDKGQITSPNYPFDYGPDLKCAFVVEAPEDEIVVTTIIDLDVRKEISEFQRAYFLISYYYRSSRSG